MKREENMKYWKKKIIFVNIKNYTAHPHDMMHVCGTLKCENAAICER